MTEGREDKWKKRKKGIKKGKKLRGGWEEAGRRQGVEKRDEREDEGEQRKDMITIL